MINLIKYLFLVFWCYSKPLTIIRIVSYVILKLEVLIYAFITASLVDSVIESVKTKDINNVVFSFTWIIAFFILIRVVMTVNLYAEASFESILRFRPKMMMYSKLNKLSVQDLESPELQNKLQRFEESVYATGTYFIWFLDVVGSFVLVIVSMNTVLFFIPQVVLLIFLLNIPVILLNNKLTKNIFSYRLSKTEERRRVDILVNNLLDGNKFKEIKLTNAFGFIKNMYEDFQITFYRGFMNMKKTTYLSLLPIQILMILLKTWGMYIIVEMVLRGDLSIGSIAFYFSSISIMDFNVRSLASNLSNLRGGVVNMQDTLDLYSYKEETNKIFSNIILVNAPQIVLENVTFSYPGSDVKIFENLNLTINSGEKIAIVGENGSGKTTIVKLISGIYKVDSGNIFINGVSLYDINPDDWFRALGLLFQDFNTYEALTVEENIAIGDTYKPLDFEKISLSAEMSGAKSFVEKYPSEYKQILSEKFKGGIRPSGGQWQKIAISRFFYRNSPLLILDEPTSAIDAVAEASIFKKIYEFIGNKTVVIVSHRFSTVRHADRIVVVDKGEIVEEGTHEELLKNGGLYNKMFNVQAVGYK